MSGVLFFDRHYRQTIRTAFRRQIKIDNFRELFLQNRHEHFVQCYTQYRRFIWRTPGIGGMINRIFTLGNMRHGKYRKTIDFVIVTGVVAIRPFRRSFALFDIPFQHNLRTGGHFKVIGDTLHHFGLGTAQQSGKRIL